VHLAEPDLAADFLLGEPSQESQLDDATFPMLERRQDVSDDYACLDAFEVGIDRGRLADIALLVAIPMLEAPRGLLRARLDHLALRPSPSACDLGGGRETLQLARQVLDDSSDFKVTLLQPTRRANCPAMITQVTFQRPCNGRHRERGKGESASGVEPVGSVHKCEQRNLAEVFEVLSPAYEAVRK